MILLSRRSRQYEDLLVREHYPAPHSASARASFTVKHTTAKEREIDKIEFEAQIRHKLNRTFESLLDSEAARFPSITRLSYKTSSRKKSFSGVQAIFSFFISHGGNCRGNLSLLTLEFTSD